MLKLDSRIKKHPLKQLHTEKKFTVTIFIKRMESMKVEIILLI